MAVVSVKQQKNENKKKRAVELKEGKSEVFVCK
jgi:hypothetical protein